MNAGGHIAVVASLDASRGADGYSPGRLLGAAMPDLAAMGRFRLLGSTTDQDVTAGIALHHRTDELFHGHSWFRERNRQLTKELTEAGVRRGPAMACSHVGIELLLDGELLQDRTILAANVAGFDAIEDRRHALDELVEPVHRRRWLNHLDRCSSHRLPRDYHRPEAVARRLHRILAARPRLALPEEQIGVVATSLAAHKPSIDATALGLIADLGARLRAMAKTA